MSDSESYTVRFGEGTPFAATGYIDHHDDDGCDNTWSTRLVFDDARLNRFSARDLLGPAADHDKFKIIAAWRGPGSMVGAAADNKLHVLWGDLVAVAQALNQSARVTDLEKKIYQLNAENDAQALEIVRLKKENAQLEDGSLTDGWRTRFRKPVALSSGDLIVPLDAELKE